MGGRVSSEVGSVCIVSTASYPRQIMTPSMLVDSHMFLIDLLSYYY